jgi:serine-type D-Ala-D-Ala carboxypeptidase/endopeptidase (penicillin-binding protein 4)
MAEGRVRTTEIKQTGRRFSPRSRCKKPSLFLLLGLLLAASRLVFPAECPSRLENQILKLIGQPKLETGFWGIQVVSVKDGRVLFSLNDAKHFLPASNMKLIVGAAALDRLGAAYQFETPVYSRGRIDSNGRLLGELVLVGRGDPNLEGRVYDPEPEIMPKAVSPLFIEQIADRIASRGIRIVQGDIVGDDTCFLYEPYAPAWEHADLLWGYGAPASALAVNENVFTVEVSPGDTVGDPAVIKLIPSVVGISPVNNVKTVEKSRPNSIGIDHGPDRGAWIIQGELPKDHAKLDYTLAVEDPAEFAASLLKSALEQRGIQVTGKSRARHLYPLEALEEGKPSTERAKSLQSRFLPEQKLTSHESVKLIETVKIMMKMSHNLYAELLLRKLGEEFTGIGSIETGVAAVKAFLEKTGTSQEEMNISDGSGMSRTDLITPRSIVRLLLYMERHPEAKLFEDTLPVSGLDGTLEHRMKKPSARGHIHAKTGTSAFVNTLSGYAYTRNDETLAFSIMVNNLTLPAQEIRGVVDQICALMTDYDCKKDAANHD